MPDIEQVVGTMIVVSSTTPLLPSSAFTCMEDMMPPVSRVVRVRAPTKSLSGLIVPDLYLDFATKIPPYL